MRLFQQAIELCVNRFDDDTKEAFLDLYTKCDATVSGVGEYPNDTSTKYFEDGTEMLP